MIPCKDCLTLGICKHKTYEQLLNDCPPLFNLLYDGDSYNGRRIKIAHYGKSIKELDKLFKRRGNLCHAKDVY